MLTPTQLKSRLDAAGLPWAHVCTATEPTEISVHLRTDDRAVRDEMITRLAAMDDVVRAALPHRRANDRRVLVVVQADSPEGPDQNAQIPA